MIELTRKTDTHEGATITETLYQINDDATEGMPIFVRIETGTYGPRFALYREDPRRVSAHEPPREPDVHVQIDYFAKILRLRIWEDGVLSRSDNPDEEEASQTISMFTQKEM